MGHGLHELIFLSSAFSSAAVEALISAAWQSAILVAGVAFSLRFFPRMTSAARSAIWMMVLLVLVSLPVAAMFGGGHSSAMTQGGLVSSAVHIDPRWSFVLAGAWLLFSLVRAVQLVLSAISLRRIARRAVPLGINFPENENQFESYERGLVKEKIYRQGRQEAPRIRHGSDAVAGSCRRAEICISDDVERPCVAGFFSPRVLLPSTLLKKLSPSDMTQIVLHEMEHLRRADDWTNLLQKASLVLFPLNPALWWVERRLCMERELACDDHVMHATKARKAYAACLANLAEHSMLRRGISLALGAWERQTELTRRVHRILRGSREGMGRRQSQLVTGVLACGLLGGAFGLAHSPKLVSFAPVPVAEAAAPVESGPLSAKMVRTAYHEPAVAPKLVKAELALAKPVRVVSSKKQRRRPSISAARPAVAASWFVLTEWHGTVHSREAVQPIYAAVPVQDGWLIFQL